MSESYRVAPSTPPQDLDDQAMAAWWKAERARMCREMHQLADFLFGPEETLPPGGVEIH